MTLEFPLHAPTPPISTLDDDDDSDEQGEIDVDAEMEELLESLTASLQSNRQSRGKIRRRARDNLQTEVGFLRNKVQQMEEELRALRLEHLDNMAPVPAPSTPAATLAFSSQAFGFPLSIPQVNEAPPIWDLAARQQRWRQKAVKENARLRMVLNTQASLAKSMEAQLGKRIRQQFTSEGCTPDNLVAQSWSPSFALETETVDALQYGLNTAFNELDAVFAANGLDRLEMPRTEARIREGENGMYLDIFAHKLMPFDFETTTTATWNHYRGDTRQCSNLYHDFAQDGDSSSDTVMEMVAMKFTGKSTNADFHVKQALRRYVEADRQVVVWVSKAEAAENQISTYSNFAFVDKGYVVVKRPMLAEQELNYSTVLQICCLISPQMTRGCVLDATTVGAFTEFVLSVMVASISATQELVERILIEEAQQILQ
ncbi:hypothetical protein BBJ29_009416 [Phytophthora kernoviae]|uniref:M96 mating-specific protein family n=1 Tax=Phytophthora kernoviae TaxID=325452 RepID=A0A3F2RBE5_9STRA|nr:hypothetical protein BBP00_00009873 [Phytophthora kernoviae]RLN67661.1 hypothetical protein BBJ29_009416 [Phytophthora kernoviae]